VPLLAAVVLTYGVFAEPDTVIHDVKKLASIMPAEAARLVGQQLMELVKASDGKKGLGVVAALAIALLVLEMEPDQSSPPSTSLLR
jgi:membrane protein